MDNTSFKQIDIFGKAHEITPTKKTSRNKYLTMQKMYGLLESEKCKNCKHFIRKFHNNKTYFKCEKWIESNSSATDIRANDIACSKFEKGEE